MSVHRLKTWTDVFDALVDGSKPFEIRGDDRGFAVGDTLALEEWDRLKASYTGRATYKKVTFVLRGAPWLPEGVVCMGLGSLNDPKANTFVRSSLAQIESLASVLARRAKRDSHAEVESNAIAELAREARRVLGAEIVS